LRESAGMGNEITTYYTFLQGAGFKIFIM